MEIDLVYYIALAALSILQGPIAILVGAGVATTGVITPWGVFIAVTIANLSVDIFWFLIGRLGKIEWVLRVPILKIDMKTVQKVEENLEAHAPKIITLAKLSSVFVLPVMFAAGLMHLPWKRWFPTLFSVEVIKNIILIFAGFYSVISITQFKNWLTVLTIPFIILSLTIPWWLFRRSLHLDKE